MLHPSYTDLIDVVNSDIEPGEQPVVQSRYSIVIAASRRARQIIGGEDPMVSGAAGKNEENENGQQSFELFFFHSIYVPVMLCVSCCETYQS